MTNDDNEEDKNRLISLAEAEQLYGLDRNYLRNLVLKGRLNAQKFGHIWSTSPADVEAYLDSRKRQPPNSSENTN